MPALNELHNELRLKIPNKPYELYNDVLRWAINEMCRKTEMWEVISTIITIADQSVYELDLPSGTITHSNLKIIDGTRTIERPENGAINLNWAPADSIQTFDSYSKNEIQIFPTPLNGGKTLEVYTAVKPIRNITEIANEEFFDEYSDTVVCGALHRLYEDTDIQKSDREYTKFRNGISSIKVDVILRNANTPFKLDAGW